MKIPSRYMPKKAEPEKGSYWTMIICIFIIILPALIIFVRYGDISGFVALLVIILGILGLVLIGGIIGYIFFDNPHFKKLKEDREGESICTFTRCFDCRSVDTWIIRAVYEEIREWLGQEFPLRSSDSIFDDLKIDIEDFEWDIIEIISQRTGRSLSEPEKKTILR